MTIDTTTRTKNPFKIGDRVRAVNHVNAGRPSFAADGALGTVTKVKSTLVVVDLDIPGRDNREKVTANHEWFVPLEPSEEPTGRPTVTLTKQTSLDYAKAANSRVLKDENQAILKAAANGETVDAYEFNRALLEAMSSASTRLGQSMGRRDLTRKIRHLGYIVQGILENHADGLPAYETGERSRAVEEHRAARVEAEDVALKAINALDEQTAKFTAYREAADKEVTRLINRVTKVREEQREERRKRFEVEAARDNYAEAFGYVIGRLSAEERQRAFGYLDALEAAVV